MTRLYNYFIFLIVTTHDFLGSLDFMEMVFNFFKSKEILSINLMQIISVLLIN